MPTSRRLSSSLRPALRLPLIALALATLYPLHAGPAGASLLAAEPRYMGYRIPEHRWSYWTASLDGSGSHRAGTTGSDDRARDGGLGGRLGTRMGAGYDSDRLLYNADLTVDVNGSRSGSWRQDRFAPTTFESRSSAKSLGQQFLLGGAVRTYPWNVPVGISISSQNRLDLGQAFQSSSASTSSPPFRTTYANGYSRGDRRYAGSVSAWAGLGRVRDATPVQQAYEIEKRLRQTGAITRPLSDETRTRLAALFSVENHFGQVHERPQKHFWRELERLLREDGALAQGSLDAYDVLRALEPIALFGAFPRRTGFFVGPAVTFSTTRVRFTEELSSSSIQYAADTVYWSTSDASSETVETRADDVFTSISAEFYRPLAPRWQLDAFSRAAIRESGEFLALSNSLSLLYIFSDRWLGVGRFSHDAVAAGHARRFDRWGVTLRGELYYFLEDAWTLRLAASEQQYHYPAGFERSGSFQLGVTWLLSGRFETPGLLETMRPTPPTP